SAENIHPFLPQKDKQTMALLPLHQNSQGSSDTITTTERDILYKLFFDMKKDMNDLKQMIFEIAQTQGYPIEENMLPNRSATYQEAGSLQQVALPQSSNTPILLRNNELDHHEEVEESLLLS